MKRHTSVPRAGRFLMLVLILLFGLPGSSSRAALPAQTAPLTQKDDGQLPTYRLEVDTLVRVDTKAGEDPGPVAGSRVQVPKLTHSTDPKFPRKSERERGGVCTLSIVVGVDGRVRDVAVITSLSPAYDSNAMAAVAKYRFQPALLDGRPIAMKIKVEMKFAGV